MTLQRIHDLIAKWLVLEDHLFAVSIMAAVVANRLPGDPLWLMVVGPPSTAKTELIMLMKGLKDTYVLSDLTPRTFFSGYKSSEGQDFSLLPKLLNKTILHKDFTTVLSMSQEKRVEILSQLREIYDGEWSKHFGNRAAGTFEGKVGMIAGCTPAIDLHHRTTAILGERFVYFRHDLLGDELREASARRAVDTNPQHDALSKVARAAVQEYMEGLPVCDPSLPDAIKESLITLAEAVAWGRCPVSRDGYSRAILQLPRPEGPGRVVKQLATLARAHAALYQRRVVTPEDMQLPQRVAKDTIPPLRVRLIQEYGKHADGAEVKQVALRMQIPYSTVREHTEDAQVVGLLEDVAERKALTERGQSLLACLKDTPQPRTKKRR